MGKANGEGRIEGVGGKLTEERRVWEAEQGEGREGMGEGPRKGSLKRKVKK